MVKLLKNPANLIYLAIFFLVSAAGFTGAAFLYPGKYIFILSAVSLLLVAITVFAVAFRREE